MRNLEKLDPEQRAVVYWQYKLYGGFYKALFDAVCRADNYNLRQLSLGFPNEVNGYIKYKDVPGWWDNVQQIIKEGPYAVVQEGAAE